jgi:hypothetical protein
MSAQNTEKELEERVYELRLAIEGICLGSIESTVIEAAVNELMDNWHDHCE